MQGEAKVRVLVQRAIIFRAIQDSASPYLARYFTGETAGRIAAGR